MYRASCRRRTRFSARIALDERKNKTPSLRMSEAIPTTARAHCSMRSSCQSRPAFADVGHHNVTLGQQLKALAPGLTPRSVLEKFATVQMIDVYVPTNDERELSLTRYTQPEPELKLLLEKLKLTLPAQTPPRITAREAARTATV